VRGGGEFKAFFACIGIDNRHGPNNYKDTSVVDPDPDPGSGSVLDPYSIGPLDPDPDPMVRLNTDPDPGGQK
jgi:hypothetical protein